MTKMTLYYHTKKQQTRQQPKTQTIKISTSFLIALVVASSCLLRPVNAILPTAEIEVIIPNSSYPDGFYKYQLLASQGNFAPMAPQTKLKNLASSISNRNKNNNNGENKVFMMTPTLPPENDPLLCGSTTPPNTISSNRHHHHQRHRQLQFGNPNINADNPIVFLVPRGTCSFQHKALVAQQVYGAAGVIIYGTLSSRYGLNETTNEIEFPLEFYDYDCSMTKGGGKINIPKSKLIGFDSSSSSSSSYNVQNDNLLSGTKKSGNLCALYSEHDTFENGCPSNRCLLTGNETKTESYDEMMMEACCAWDKHIYLYRDDSMSDPDTGRTITPINIPVFYITMEEADMLLRDMNTMSGLMMYSRWYPKYNISAVLVWALGVFVAAIASYLSASEIRYARRQMEKRLIDQQEGNGNDGQNQNNNDDATALSMRGYQAVTNGGEYRRAIPPEETLELTPMHAIFFLVFSTAGLLTLFYFKIYNVVKVFYAFGCSGAILQVIVMPLYYYIAKRISFRDRVVLNTQCADIGTVTLIDLLAVITSYGLGATWIYLAFAVRHPDTIPFFWIMQNVMGACMCILFLQTMKLNSIQVASILLIAAFFYDIFFVFVTPYLTKGGKSIMVDVATSGGPPQADPSWCEKYPDGPECQGGDPLPMLFTIPRIGDYAGGSSLLGLGDIVLPGLLLSFASRYDEAKRLIGASHSPRSPHGADSSCGKRNGYFVPAVIAYAIGLAMANVAVYVMKMGQPALLYLVPCCLGTIVYLGWRRGELSDLWNTPKVLTSCDEILYGNDRQEIDVSDEHHNNEDIARSGSHVDSMEIS